MILSHWRVAAVVVALLSTLLNGSIAFSIESTTKSRSVARCFKEQPSQMQSSLSSTRRTQSSGGVPFQKNNRRAWLYMSIYWAIGWCVALAFGYCINPFSSWPKRPMTVHNLAALAVTVGIQPRWLSRYGNFGRQPDPLAIATFAGFNGIFETALYLATYDLGRYLYASLFHMYHNKFLAATLGFLTYSVYSALIHAKFWQPHVFPQHVLPTAPPFFEVGLTEVTLMGLSWMYVYETTGDAFFVCILHMLMNVFSSIRMGLEGPNIWPCCTREQ